jgi:hypothetical protein
VEFNSSGGIFSAPETAQITSIDRARGMKVRRAGQGPVGKPRIGLSCPFLVTFFDKKKSNRGKKV